MASSRGHTHAQKLGHQPPLACDPEAPNQPDPQPLPNLSCSVPREGRLCLTTHREMGARHLPVFLLDTRGWAGALWSGFTRDTSGSPVQRLCVSHP